MGGGAIASSAPLATYTRRAYPWDIVERWQGTADRHPHQGS